MPRRVIDIPREMRKDELDIVTKKHARRVVLCRIDV